MKQTAFLTLAMVLSVLGGVFLYYALAVLRPQAVAATGSRMF